MRINRIIQYACLWAGFLIPILFPEVGLPVTRMFLSPSSDGIIWSSPLSLYEKKGSVSTVSLITNPNIVADPAGDLHLVWSANVDHPQEAIHPDTIYYMRKSESEWTRGPVDIFVASEGSTAVVNRLRMDQQGNLILLWTGNSRLNLSKAPYDRAGIVSAWQTTSIGEPASSADFAIGADGTYYLVYILDRQGLYCIRSVDQGQIWSTSVPIWQVPNESYSGGSTRIEVSAKGTIHVVWGVNSSSIEWRSLGYNYARSANQGETWQNKFSSYENDALPNVGFDEKGNIHIVANNPAGSMKGRSHAWSQDDGITWRVERIFPGYSGLTLWPVMVQDSLRVLHLVTSANSPSVGEPQLYYSTWSVDHWTDPELISGSVISGEQPSIAVSNGNQINVVWITSSIWYVSGQSSAPRVDPTRLPTSSAAPSMIPQLEGTPTIKVTPTSTSIAALAMINGPEQSSNLSVTFPIEMGIIPVVCLVAAIFYYKLARNRK